MVLVNLIFRAKYVQTIRLLNLEEDRAFFQMTLFLAPTCENISGYSYDPFTLVTLAQLYYELLLVKNGLFDF